MAASVDDLPLTVPVDAKEEDLARIDCDPDQYLDPTTKECSQCTICEPGMQHSLNEACGHGMGFNQTCEPCPDGYYQPGTGSLVRCTGCITCDRSAETLQECSRENDAECGPCCEGTYAFDENICIDCEADRGHKDCIKPIIDPKTNQTIPCPGASTPIPDLTTIHQNPSTVSHPLEFSPNVSTGISSPGLPNNGGTYTSGAPIIPLSVLIVKDVVIIVITIIVIIAFLACMLYMLYIACKKRQKRRESSSPVSPRTRVQDRPVMFSSERGGGYDRVPLGDSARADDTAANHDAMPAPDDDAANQDSVPAPDGRAADQDSVPAPDGRDCICVIPL